jgi:MFS family permease
VRRELLRTAYALDTAINELMFIAGPAMVFLLMLITSPLVIVAAAGLAVLTGTAWLLSGAEPSVRFEKAKTGPLRDRATVLLLTIAALGAASFGCLRIAITAATTTLGAPAAAGAMFSLLSLGALAGGLAFGARHWTHPAWRILVLLCLADALMLLLAGWAPGLIALALLITLSGLLAGPRDTLLQVMLAQGARSAQRTEVFAWLNTFMWAGYALGTTTAGYLTEDSGAVPFTTAAMTALIGAALVVPLRRAEGTATPALRTTASDVVDR